MGQATRVQELIDLGGNRLADTRNVIQAPVLPHCLDIFGQAGYALGSPPVGANAKDTLVLGLQELCQVFQQGGNFLVANHVPLRGTELARLTATS
jgi:hypothetical protein